MELVSLVELTAVVLAGWAVWKTLPRPVERDWERLFKVTLSALSWGEAEAAGGSEAERTSRWAGDLARHTPFHPVGRNPEAKLEHARLDDVSTPALEGERALVERLSALHSPAERWQAMYVDDPRAVESLGEDPTLLGPAYSPERLVGAGVTWEAVASWAPEVPAALARRLDRVRVICVEGAPEATASAHGGDRPSDTAPAQSVAGPAPGAEGTGVGPDATRSRDDEALAEARGPERMSAALAAAVPGLRVHRLWVAEASALPGGSAASDARGETRGQRTAEQALGLCQSPADRLVVVVTAGQSIEVVRALALAPALRDRTLAVVSLGQPIARSKDEQAWLAQHFTHAGLEPELQRTTGFFAVVDVDPSDPLSRSWAAQRFPQVPLADGERATIASIDLGPLPVGMQPTLRLARALTVLLAAWV